MLQGGSATPGRTFCLRSASTKRIGGIVVGGIGLPRLAEPFRKFTASTFTLRLFTLRARTQAPRLRRARFTPTETRALTALTKDHVATTRRAYARDVHDTSLRPQEPSELCPSFSRLPPRQPGPFWCGPPSPTHGKRSPPVFSRKNVGRVRSHRTTRKSDFFRAGAAAR